MLVGEDLKEEKGRVEDGGRGWGEEGEFSVFVDFAELGRLTRRPHGNLLWIGLTRK